MRIRNAGATEQAGVAGAPTTVGDAGCECYGIVTNFKGCLTRHPLLQVACIDRQTPCIHEAR